MASKIVKNVDDAGAVTYTETEQSFLEAGIDVALSPLSILSASDEFVNKQQAGVAALVYGMVGFVGGDMYGDRVPLLGQRRV